MPPFKFFPSLTTVLDLLSIFTIAILPALRLRSPTCTPPPPVSSHTGVAYFVKVCIYLFFISFFLLLIFQSCRRHRHRHHQWHVLPFCLTICTNRGCSTCFSDRILRCLSALSRPPSPPRPGMYSFSPSSLLNLVRFFSLLNLVHQS